MRLGTIAFFLGILIFHTLPELPNRLWGLAAALSVLPVVFRVPRVCLPAWALTGFLWALLWTPVLPQLPEALESAELWVEGWVASIPQPTGAGIRFELEVDRLSGLGGDATSLKGRLRLSWYGQETPSLRVGDKWGFPVKLKRARGLANPGAFDYERWLFVRGVFAQGYVRANPSPRLIAAAARYPIQRFRQRLQDDFQARLPNNPFLGILTALAVGERQGIRSDQWEVLRRTGTGHLVAISGLHVGLIASLAFLFVRFVWSWCPPLAERVPAAMAAALAGLLAAAAYALLAGLSLPTQRALIMVAVVMLAVMWRRPLAPSRILALALLLVLILDPVAPLSGGFWLSFGAVAMITYVLSSQGGAVSPMLQWISLQLAVSLALLPATLMLFQSFPWLSPVANLVAIPWISVTVVPLTLSAAGLGLLSETLGTGLLYLAALAMSWLWDWLYWLAKMPWGVVALPAPPGWMVLFVVPALLLLGAPRGVPGRWLAGVLCLPLIWSPVPGPSQGGVWFTLLDVGQGLAAVVRTAGHTLVYDAGPRLGAGLDAGAVAVAPFLTQLGGQSIDTLIISHADSQHMGGTRAVLESVGARRVLTPSPRDVPVTNARSCRRGMSWIWDEVKFSLLHPPVDGGFARDNASCVLLVESRGGRILLPGDIEPAAEAALTRVYGTSLRADVLVAPHHGSRDASLTEFLAAVAPRFVLFSTGYRNRFGYPRPATTVRYGESDARVLDTGRHGAITFRLEPGRHPIVPDLQRHRRRHYWQQPRQQP